MNNWREFRFPRKEGADLVWMIKQDGESYSTQHGQLNGKFQINTDIPGSKGKANTKAFMSAKDNTSFHISREIRKKTEAGYIEVINGKLVAKQVAKIDFNKHLPKQFTGYKPQQSIADSTLKKLCLAGKARFTRKYDGQCHIAVHHNWGWEIYSRRMDKATERFPRHIAELKAKPQLVRGTILIGEMVCTKNGMDDFDSTASFCRSDPEKSRNLIKWGEVSEPLFVIFDMLYFDGLPLKKSTYDQRCALWREEFLEYRSSTSTVIVSADLYNVNHDNWEEFAIEKEWEGFVVTDGDSIPGEKFFSFNGKAKRPKGHHKLKPVFEADAVVFAAKYGTGKRKDGAGSVFLKQLDPDTGKWFYAGGAGSGFTDETLEQLQPLLKKHGLPIFKKETEVDNLNIQDNNGFVVMIEYSDRTPGLNKFRFGIFKRFRDDKGVDECEAEWFSSKKPVELEFLKEK